VIKATNDYDALLFLKVDAQDLVIEEFLDRLVNELGGKFLKTEWQSRFNEYVVYNYPPFCIGGFDLHYTIQFKTQAERDFAAHLYTKRLEAIEYLKRCHDLNCNGKVMKLGNNLGGKKCLA
jgi:hypothetical protein